MRILRVFTIVLLFLNGSSAIAGGIGLIGDPSGKALGWTTEMLQHTPFDDYLIPGIVLFIGNGLLSILIAALTIKKKKHYPLYIIFQGSFLCGWIIAQIVMIRVYHPLHLICMVIGLLLIVCGYILSAIAPLNMVKS